MPIRSALCAASYRPNQIYRASRVYKFMNLIIHDEKFARLLHLQQAKRIQIIFRLTMLQCVYNILSAFH